MPKLLLGTKSTPTTEWKHNGETETETKAETERSIVQALAPPTADRKARMFLQGNKGFHMHKQGSTGGKH